MSNRRVRASVARETIEILRRGRYALPYGPQIDIREPLRRSCEGTIVYRPDDFPAVFDRRDELRAQSPDDVEAHVEVVNATTLAAARRMAERARDADPLCLNFASARNPGGGFLQGSQAQEESLARASGLSACLEAARPYYEANRQCGTALYTHHMVYSPQVPVFRDDDDQLLADPYEVSFITAPAVNARALRQHEPQRVEQIETVMLERIERLLSVALVHGHRVLVLGAWGCGVFGNDPARVASWFHAHLIENPVFRNRFRHVAFAVLDRSRRAEVIGPFLKTVRDGLQSHG